MKNYKPKRLEEMFLSQPSLVIIILLVLIITKILMMIIAILADVFRFDIHPFHSETRVSLSRTRQLRRICISPNSYPGFSFLFFSICFLSVIWSSKGWKTVKKNLSSFVIFRLQCLHYLLFNIQVTFFSSVIFSTSIMNITMNYKYN